MRVARVVGIWLAILAGVTASLIGAGVLAHDRALAVTLEKRPAPPGTGDPVRVTVRVTNRLAAFVPTSGFGRNSSWQLERKTRFGEWVSLIPARPRSLAWLAPYQSTEDTAQIDEPSILRARVYSGTHGEVAHVSNILRVFPDDFDHPPYDAR
jgi:uncharacterized protein (DUF58 family)